MNLNLSAEIKKYKGIVVLEINLYAARNSYDGHGFIFCIKNQDGRSEAEQPESKSIPEKVEDISDTMSLLNSSGLSNSFPGVIDHSMYPLSLCS